VRGIFGIRGDYVEMSNKKDYKIFRRTSKVLMRDILFRKVIRTLIPSMNIDENGIGRSINETKPKNLKTMYEKYYS